MSENTASHPSEELKCLIIDDEITTNENDREDFILDLGLPDDLVFFAADYESALKIINNHPDIAVCFVDSRIPKDSRTQYELAPNGTEWGISLIPKINETYKNAKIIVYSAYVTRSYLVEQAHQYNNITAFIDKLDGIQHRKELYLQAARQYLETVYRQQKPGKNRVNLSQKNSQIFDYSHLDSELSTYLQEKTKNIKKLIKRSSQDIIDIGKSLTDIKNRLDYGQFYAWLELEFDWSYRTAVRFMRVSERFASDNLSELNILPSALYELSASSVPEAASQEALKRAKQGETISLNTAKEIKNKYSITKKSGDSKNKILSRTRAKQTVISSNPGILAPDSTSNSISLNNFTPLNEPNKKTTTQEIIKVLKPQSTWQLGKHFLFCGDPNSPQFITRLPAKISLNLSFAPQNNWQFSWGKVDSNLSFYTKYEQDLDVKLLLEAVEHFVKITTNEDDCISVCFVPHPTILPLIDRLGCQCFIAESDRSKCDSVRTVWGTYKS